MARCLYNNINEISLTLSSYRLFFKRYLQCNTFFNAGQLFFEKKYFSFLAAEHGTGPI